ncbi:MAG: single-stranded DNA-binding protein [Chloroflexi bacterium]|nr:single-stranded DNA-binding protein [Chloroflexota bacterium]MBV9600548.1 single-stranded DNA-binding protein [Chloroflexota bacterium]
MLRVTLLGNLGGDPEVRFTQKGTQFAQFSVAVNQVRLGPDRERQETTEWFRVKVSGRQLEYAQRLGKGNRVLVLGRLDIGHYQSKEGEPRVSFDVWADEVQSASTPRSFAADLDGPDADVEAAGEPALAGVSSLDRGGAGANARSQAPNGRGRPPRGDSGGSGGSAEDLEDLPF